MKTNALQAASMLFFLLFASLMTQAGAQSQNHSAGDPPPPGLLQFSISIPDAMQSQITRQDFENQSIFSFKNENGKTAFLFSVNKVTDQQWLSIKQDVKNYTILENQDGFITFIQKTTDSSIKGKDNTKYQQVLQQVDAIIASIHM